MTRSRKREYIIWDTENDGGTNLEEWGLYLSDFSETPPEPKTTIVEIPYGDNIDITESLTGDVQYSRREQTWTLTLLGNSDRASVQKAYTELLNNVHGKTKKFKLSWDEKATYTGRATVEENEQLDAGDVAQYTVSLDCEPWRDLDTVTYELSGVMCAKHTFKTPRRQSNFTVTNTCDERLYMAFDVGSKEYTAHQYSINFDDTEIPLHLKQGTHEVMIIPMVGTKMRMYTDVINDFDIASTLSDKDILEKYAIQIIYADLDNIKVSANITIPWKEL